MLHRIVVGSLIGMLLVAPAVIADPLVGEWISEDVRDRRLVLTESGAFELSLRGRSTQEEFFIVQLDLTSERAIFGYGISGRPSAAIEPDAHVYRIREPIVSQQSMLKGSWESTATSLTLMVNEFEISHVDGMPATEYVGALIREELEDESLTDEARKGFADALERLVPILIQQDDPFDELKWEISLSGSGLSIVDPNGEFTGEWVRASVASAIAVSTWATVKIDPRR